TNRAIKALDGRLIYDGYCRMDIDFINIPSWVVHNNKGIETPSTIVSSAVTPPIPHGLPSTLESSAHEPPTQSALIPSQPTVRSSCSNSVDSSPVDLSLSFRTLKLDPSPQTHLSPKTSSRP
ncbi:hypothetical protein Dimus_016585, partial [Dionaea muscipula]